MNPAEKIKPHAILVTFLPVHQAPNEYLGEKGKPQAILVAGLITLVWLLACAAGYFVLWMKWLRLPASDYQSFLPIAGSVLFLAAIGSILAVAIEAKAPNAKLLNSPLVLVISLFWGLFPPLWFLLEYYAYSNGSILLPEFCDDGQRKAFLDSVGKFEDLAAKVWAGVGAILAVMVSQFGK